MTIHARRATLHHFAALKKISCGLDWNADKHHSWAQTVGGRGHVLGGRERPMGEKGDMEFFQQ